MDFFYHKTPTWLFIYFEKALLTNAVWEFKLGQKRSWDGRLFLFGLGSHLMTDGMTAKLEATSFKSNAASCESAGKRSQNIWTNLHQCNLSTSRRKLMCHLKCAGNFCNKCLKRKKMCSIYDKNTILNVLHLL